MATGFNKQSEDPPSACLVELPSNAHTGQSSNFPLKSDTTFVFPLRLAVGLYPSNQIYSNLDLLIMLVLKVILKLINIYINLIFDANYTAVFITFYEHCNKIYLLIRIMYYFSFFFFFC